MKRTNTAKWVESAQRWQINVQKDGKRKTFTSTKPGRTGSHRGDALKQARESAGMSMRQLAEKAGVSANTVSLIENGQSNPRADVLAALAKALGTTMDAIWT